MANDFSNDNYGDDVVPVPSRGLDAHGQAAMLLVECLIHGLIERKIISVADAVEMVDTAREVKVDTGPELGDSLATMQKAIQLLESISASLRRDI